MDIIIAVVLAFFTSNGLAAFIRDALIMAYIPDIFSPDMLSNIISWIAILSLILFFLFFRKMLKKK